ncbi:hypothetical protein J7L06_00915 [Candidatus Bathyarchaeota archaeon]|nr:hypothetical protein [Candidatus Bathyarchaeota archaeon]
MKVKRLPFEPPLNRKALLLSFTALLLLAALFLTLNVNPAGGVSVTAYSGKEYTLADFPRPFIPENGSNVNTFIVIPTSNPHGPCGAAHTMDTMGGVLIAYILGVESAENGTPINLETAMDCYSYISVYDSDNVKVTMKDATSNLIVIGGPGVNQVAYYYNELRDDQGKPVLPVVYVRDSSGGYLYVQSTGDQYRIEKDGNGRVVADYGVIQIYRDGTRYVLLVYGLGGEGTRVAAEVLSNFNNWNLNGIAVIIKYFDNDGDGFLDTMSIVETVPAPDVTVEVYSDSECTTRVSSIDWGIVEAGGSTNTTVYVKNVGNTPVTLSLSTQNWNPPKAVQYISVDWDYDGRVLAPGEVIPVTLTLTVSPDATDITDFSFEIVITSQG